MLVKNKPILAVVMAFLCMVLHAAAVEAQSSALPVQINEVLRVLIPDTLSVLNNTDLNISGISISNPSAASGSLPVTLFVSHGIITLPVSSELGYIKGNGTEKVTLIGSLDDINTALSGLKYHSTPQFIGIDTLTISANDMGDVGSYGLNTTTNTVAINVLDRPRVIVPVKQIQWTPNNAMDSTDLTITGTFIKNDSAGSNNVRVTLTAGQGTIILNAQTHLVSIAGNGTGSITLTGNLTVVNSALFSMSYRFKPNYSGSDTISITAMDLGSLASCSGSIDINRATTNDILIVSAPQGFTVINSTSYKLQGGFITYLNPANDNMQAVISASHGTLSLSSVSGLEYIGGKGTSSMTLAGSLVNINSALAALIYTPVPGYSGAESIVLDVADLNTYKAASGTAAFNVTATGNANIPATDTASDGSNMSTVQLSGSTINIKPALDFSDGAAKSSLTLDDIAGAALNAQQDSSGGWYITITVSPVAGVNTYKLSLPSNALLDVTAAMRIIIATPLCTLTIPSNLFYGTDTVGKDAVISVSSVDSSGFPVDKRTAIGDSPVIELGVTLGGLKTDWKSNSTPVTVSIPYHPSAIETANPEHIAVWCLDDSGNASPVPNCRYDAFAEMVNFTVNHFSKYAISFVNKTFTDLSGYAWAKEQIEMMASRGIINGTSSSTFSPSANITRGDFIKLLITALGLTADVTDNFSDVRKTAHYYNTVGIAKTLGIVSENADGKFNPDAHITRLDMMIMTAKALEITKPNMPSGSSSDLSGFSDMSKIPLSASEYVATLVKNEIISGANGKLNPAQFMSRAEAAAILYRVLQVE